MDKSLLYDELTFKIMRCCLKHNSNCIDVGAHSGVFIREILKLSPKGTHFAFEPLPDMYKQIVNLYKNANVMVYQVALSDTTGESTFYHVVTNSAYSGLKIRRYDRPNETIQKITVKTDRLDNIVPKDLPIHFMKIDVEGGELHVFQGGVETIRRSRPIIVFECGLGALDYYGKVPDDVYHLLEGECALQISVMEDWLNGNNPLSGEQFRDQFYQGINYYFVAHP